MNQDQSSNTEQCSMEEDNITSENSEEQLYLRVEQLKEHNAKLRAKIEYLHMVSKYL